MEWKGKKERLLVGFVSLLNWNVNFRGNQTFGLQKASTG